MSGRRWTCPKGEHPGQNAPGRLRKKDLRRYCLPCSIAAGELVERVCLTDQRRAELRDYRRREVARAEARTESESRRRAIERFAAYCGPAVLAKRLGIKRTTAAKRLAKAAGEIPRSGVRTSVVRRVLTAAGQRHRYYVASGKQTVRQWRDTNPGATAILATTHHYLYLSHGRMVEDNGRKSSRAIVQEVISFDPPIKNPLFFDENGERAEQLR